MYIVEKNGGKIRLESETQLAAFLKGGYKLVEQPVAPKAEAPVEQPPDMLTRSEVFERADELGIDYPRGISVEKLLALIADREAAK